MLILIGVTLFVGAFVVTVIASAGRRRDSSISDR